MVALAPFLSESLLQKAVDHARSMEFPLDRIAAFLGLEPHLPEPLREEIKEEIKEKVKEIDDDDAERRVLVALKTPPPPPSDVFDELAKARAFGKPYEKAKALLDLAPYLTGPLKGEALWEAFSAAKDDTRHETFGQPAIAALAAQRDVQMVFETRSRFLNVCLTDANHTQVIERSNDLAAKAAYALRVDIGQLSPESVVINPGSFPEDKLPSSNEGWWLEAIAVSDDFNIEPQRHYFFLPLNGPSWVCACQPGGEQHHCTVNERKTYLYIPVQAPAEPGSKTIRLTIYFRKNAVQSLLLTAQVAQVEQAGEGYHAEIDFRLTARLDELDFLPERSANILVNKNLNGTHRLVINGQTASPQDLTLSPTSLQKITDGLRIQLKEILYGNNDYDENNAKPKKAFVEDLKALAKIGCELYTPIYTQINNKIERSLVEPGTIQITLVATEFVYPWAFIYDIGKESHAEWQLCQLLHDWDSKIANFSSDAKCCPHEQNHTMNTLCPFGFWGYRHILELPPRINPENTDKVKQVIPVSGQLDVIFIQNTKLNPKITSNHIHALQQKLGSLWTAMTSLEATKSALERPGPQIVYFYVHGKKLEESLTTRTSLLVGNDEEITPDTITTWHRYIWSKIPDHWCISSPLIFINGCHTADLLPDSPVSFVNVFCRAAAAGVIGTEITISQQVASEIGKTFFTYLVTKTGAGEALRLARLSLLNKGNLLGLVYTAYCAAELTLK